MWGFQMQNSTLFSECKCAFEFWRHHILFFYFSLLGLLFLEQFYVHRGRYRDFAYIPCPPIPASPTVSIPQQRIHLLKIDEPELTRHTHPKFIVYCYHFLLVFFGFGRMPDDLFPALWYHAEYFTALKVFCALPLHSFSAPTSGNPWSFPVSIVLLFQTVMQSGLYSMQPFSDWLLYLAPCT